MGQTFILSASNRYHFLRFPDNKDMRKSLFVLLLLTAACTKKDVPLDPDLDIASWNYCQNSLDKETTLNRMLGNWKLVGTSCSECSDYFIKKAEENVHILKSIGSDGPHIVYSGNEAQDKGSDFSLIETSRKNSFTLATEKEFLDLNTSGTVEVCQENRLSFRNVNIEHFYVCIK